MTAFYNEIEPFAADWIRNPVSSQLVQIWHSSIKRMVTGSQQSRGQAPAKPGVNIHGQTGKGVSPAVHASHAEVHQRGASFLWQLRQEAASGCCDPITTAPCGNLRRLSA